MPDVTAGKLLDENLFKLRQVDAGERFVDVFPASLELGREPLFPLCRREGIQ